MRREREGRGSEPACEEHQSCGEHPCPRCAAAVQGHRLLGLAQESARARDRTEREGEGERERGGVPPALCRRCRNVPAAVLDLHGGDEELLEDDIF
jgi:hypothetical protein